MILKFLQQSGNIGEELLDKEVLIESKFHADTALREFGINVINYIFHTTYNPNDFMVHHIDGSHQNNMWNNISLLFRHPVKNKTLAQFKDPNTAIHRNGYNHYPTPPASGNPTIMGINLGLTITSRVLTYDYYY